VIWLLSCLLSLLFFIHIAISQVFDLLSSEASSLSFKFQCPAQTLLLFVPFLSPHNNEAISLSFAIGALSVNIVSVECRGAVAYDQAISRYMNISRFIYQESLLCSEFSECESGLTEGIPYHTREVYREIAASIGLHMKGFVLAMILFVFILI